LLLNTRLLGIPGRGAMRNLQLRGRSPQEGELQEREGVSGVGGKAVLALPEVGRPHEREVPPQEGEHGDVKQRGLYLGEPEGSGISRR